MRFVHSDWVVCVKSWDRVMHVHVDTDYTVLPSLYFDGLYHGKSHSPCMSFFSLRDRIKG